MKKRIVLGSAVAFLVVALFALAALATTAEIYFSSDSNGNNRVTMIQEGDEVWIAVYDPDQNLDCDIRDKMSPDLKIMDPKTGAYIVWDPAPADLVQTDSITNFDYMEETGADTGLFMSHRPFQVGTRVDYGDELFATHVVDDNILPEDFQGGNWLYGAGALRGAVVRPGFGIMGTDDQADFVPWFMIDPDDWPDWWDDPELCSPFLPPFDPDDPEQEAVCYMLGRFENMDTIVLMYQDPNDAGDVAVAMGKIIDTEAVISWDQEVYKDANGSATITVIDPDENLNCNKQEVVPVFVIINPGSWNPVNADEEYDFGNSGVPSPNDFCLLRITGGVNPEEGDNIDPRLGFDNDDWDATIRWFNIYNSTLEDQWLAGNIVNNQDQAEGTYFMEYPIAGDDNVTFFDTTDPNGFCRVMFYAYETGVNTGVFEVKINQILRDLGFDSLDVRDVLVAYYVDPNDFDDFKLSTAYIEERQHSITSFTDANRTPMSEYWIGRDPIYLQVIDSNANVDPCCPEQVVVLIQDVHWEDDMEWYILDETSQNSPIFFSNAGMVLRPVWDAMGVGENVLGLIGFTGGFQLWPDNWRFEVFNEDSVYARYNDVYYTADANGILGVGDANPITAAPPQIDRIRVDNDVSFDLMEIADTQVYDGSTVKMYFRDRQGNRVTGYVNSDCVFVEVVDDDQNEDMYRRERIDAYWDGGQNFPFGPWDFGVNKEEACFFEDEARHPVNDLLGDTNIFADGPPIWEVIGLSPEFGPLAKIYVLNPRNGHWASTDLMETEVGSGDFVSVTCIDLVSQYECLPMLGVLPGDTIIAVYQDPSNHSDSAWISIKVGIGGGGTPPGQGSTTDFVDSAGNSVATYTDVDSVYVKVIDPSHAGADTLTGLEVEGTAYDLSYLEGANTDTFITDAISLVDLGAVAGDQITATYTDPTDPLDTTSDTVSIISSELVFDGFITKPNPFSDEVTFTFEGAGIPETFAVTVYNMSGHLVWSDEKANVTEIVWDGQNEAGMPLANGPYIYVAMITDGTDTYTGKGKVFINK